MTEEHRPTDHTRLSDGLSCKECMTQVIKEASEMQRVELKLLDRKLLISELEVAVEKKKHLGMCGSFQCQKRNEALNEVLELLNSYKS